MKRTLVTIARKPERRINHDDSLTIIMHYLPYWPVALIKHLATVFFKWMARGDRYFELIRSATKP